MPLTLLTGFLGAGKTTVLNRILTADHGLRVAVLVNDFGHLDIAEELVASRDGGTVRLTNGCICCSLKEDLVGAVMGLLSGPQPADHVVLEASGVADPTGIATTLLAPVFRGRIRLDGVVCVVDVLGISDAPAERELILRQLMVSDLVLLNKVDLVPESRRRQAERMIRGWLTQARIIATVQGDAPLEVLLSSMRTETDAWAEGETHADDDPCSGTSSLAACRAGACTHARHPRFDTWYYRTRAALCGEALRTLVRELPGTVYRIKGRAHLTNDHERFAVVQGVGRRLAFDVGGPMPAAFAESRLVVIGAAGSLDGDALQSAFDCCRRDAL